MKSSFRLSSRAATFALVAALGATAPLFTQSAHTAPRQKQLQIWPGRRVLLVLPLSISSNWNADPALGSAILPVAQPQLEMALTRTGKFSLTLPYRFDPVLRRGLTEKRLIENDITALISTPTLETSRPVVNKLVFDQPVMTTEVKLEEVRVGGTAALPTIQIQATGRLFQQGNPDPIKTITVTSAPSGGKTPVERVTLASSRAFNEIAAAFVVVPEAFDLLAPLAPTPAPTAKSTAPATAAMAPAAVKPATTPLPRPQTMAPNSLSPTQSGPFVPQLPAGQPPLGIAVGEDPTVAR